MLRLSSSSLLMYSSSVSIRSLYTRTHLGVESMVAKRRSALASLAEERLDARRRHLKRLESHPLMSSEVRVLIDTSETNLELRESGQVITRYIEESNGLSSETRIANISFLLNRFMKLCHHLDAVDEALFLWNHQRVQQLVSQESSDELWLDVMTSVLADLCYERGLHHQVLALHASVENRGLFKDLHRICAASCLRIGDQEAFDKARSLLKTIRQKENNVRSNSDSLSSRFYTCTFALLAARQGDYFTALEELAATRIGLALRVNLLVLFLARTNRQEEALIAMRNSVRRKASNEGSRSFTSIAKGELQFCSESVQALAEAVKSSGDAGLNKALESIFSEMDSVAKISETSLEDVLIGSNWGRSDPSSKVVGTPQRRESAGIPPRLESDFEVDEMEALEERLVDDDQQPSKAT